MFSSHAGAAAAQLVAGIQISRTAQAVDATAQTTYTTGALSYGAEDTNRKLVAMFSSRRATTGPGISSVTLGGSAMTQVVVTNDNNAINAIYILDQPTGASGALSVTFTAAMQHFGYALYRMIQPGPLTAHNTASDNTISGSTLSANLNIPDNGAAIGISTYIGQTGTTVISWSGLTEDFQANLAVTQSTYSGAFDVDMAAEVGRTISTTATTGSGFANGCLSLASWSPT